MGGERETLTAGNLSVQHRCAASKLVGATADESSTGPCTKDVGLIFYYCDAKKLHEEALKPVAPKNVLIDEANRRFYFEFAADDFSSETQATLSCVATQTDKGRLEPTKRR